MFALPFLFWIAVGSIATALAMVTFQDLVSELFTPRATVAVETIRPINMSRTRRGR